MSYTFCYYNFLIVVGGASPDCHRRGQLPRRLREETGKRSRHQGATPPASVYQEMKLLLMATAEGKRGCRSDGKAPLYISV